MSYDVTWQCAGTCAINRVVRAQRRELSYVGRRRERAGGWCTGRGATAGCRGCRRSPAIEVEKAREERERAERQRTFTIVSFVSTIYLW